MLLPALAKIAQEQHGVFRRSQALANGYDDVTIERFRRQGVWVPVRHGVYTTAERHARAMADPRLAHLLEAAARRLVIAGDTVLSHETAAVFHGLALLDPIAGEPRLTRHRPDGAGRMTAHDLYVAPVPLRDRQAGQPVTTAARTVADCARALPRPAALVTVESALHLGLDRDEVLRVLAACSGWPGSAVARELVGFASCWSESVLESLARLWFLDNDLPLPEPQLVVRDAGGRFVARVDFAWPAYRTVCELDGQLKYADRQVLWQEKRREDAVRDLGLEVVRGYWSDGADGGRALAARLRRAFVRGARAVGDPAYRLSPPRVPVHRPLAAPLPAAG